jgi:hypothetical protein
VEILKGLFWCANKPSGESNKLRRIKRFCRHKPTQTHAETVRRVALRFQRPPPIGRRATGAANTSFVYRCRSCLQIAIASLVLPQDVGAAGVMAAPNTGSATRLSMMAANGPGA